MIQLIVIALLTICCLYWYKRNNNLPDGPMGVPILGYFPFLGSNALLTIQRLSKGYANIMRLNLLGQDFYFLNSLESIKEAFDKQGEVFAGRPQTEYYLLGFVHGKKGIIASEGDIWSIQQKFMVNKLSGLGMGKTDFNFTIHDVCDDLISYLKENNEISNLYMYLSNFTSNVITTLLYGQKYHPNDQIYKELVSSIEKFMGTGKDFSFYLTGPLFKLLVLSQRKVWRNFLISKQKIFDFMYHRLKERLENKDKSDDEYNDILDYIIKEMKGPNAALFETKTTLRNYLLMFIAGTDTTSSTLNFACHFMATHPEIQRKVFEEISDVFGEDHRVLFTEIEKVNYTRAVMAEIQRFSCVVPIGLMHVNKEPATVSGYKFPNRCKFIANLESISRDKQYFKNPNVFDPNNFLDKNNNYLPNDANIPFGIGKRKCLGYKLAEMELFIGFTRLIQEFEWLPPKGEKMKFEMNDAIIRYLSPFKIIAKQRM